MVIKSLMSRNAGELRVAVPPAVRCCTVLLLLCRLFTDSSLTLVKEKASEVNAGVEGRVCERSQQQVFSRSPPLSSLPFCVGVQVSLDSKRVFNDQIKNTRK